MNNQQMFKLWDNIKSPLFCLKLDYGKEFFLTLDMHYSSNGQLEFSIIKALYVPYQINSAHC